MQRRRAPTEGPGLVVAIAPIARSQRPGAQPVSLQVRIDVCPANESQLIVAADSERKRQA